MAGSVLEELVTILGFDLDDKDIKRFNDLTDTAHQTMKGIATVGTAAAVGVGVFVNAIAIATDDTFKFAQTVGASFEEVQRLTHATEIWGGTASDVMSTLSGLAAITSRASRGAGGGEIFGILGLSPTDATTGRAKNSVKLLNEIADKMDEIGDPQRQADLLGQLGISQNMILLLRKGSEGIKELGDEVERYGFILTPEQGKVAEDYIDATVRAKLAVRGLGTEIALRLAPNVTNMIDRFLVWIDANRALVDSNLDSFVDKLTKSARPFAFLVGAIAAGLAVWAVAAFTTQAAFVLVAGGIATLLDDILRWNDGVKGTLFEKFLNWGTGEFKNADWQKAIAQVLGVDQSTLQSIQDFVSPAAAPFLGADQPLRLNVNQGTNNLAPVFHIRSTDPAGAADEVETRMEQLMRGAFGNAGSPMLS